MIILVADTSVLIELEHAKLLELAFRGPDHLATPDFLYHRELAADIGPQLLAFGLHVLELNADELSDVQQAGAANPALSLPDCAAYVAARRTDHELLTGDGALRRLALSQGLVCHGVLWLMDRLANAGTTTHAELHAGLTALAQHPRCRLPHAEVKKRLQAWQR